MTEIEIEIDGRKLSAKPGQTVIQVADEAGIYIPRFCYHKNLSIPANCRMCLVEMEKSPKAVPACATPVAPNMKIFTKSPKTLAAQRAVMEFLLINHPLDCPVCDQGGECELQDLTMGYASDKSHYDECKHSVADEDIGPLIATEMTRCIKCTRCVRFGDEIAGLRELGVINRGEDTDISTYVQHAIKSEVSGNIIDVCPVGALTSKPYRFTARPWELQQASSISPHDCIGSNLNVHTRNGKVMRVVSRENLNVNETWISDRDRFSYEGLYHAGRLEEPMAKVDGVWCVVEWQHAFELVARGLQDTITEFGVDKFGALASPTATTEEFYLLQKIVRGLGSPHVDHRLRETDTRDQVAFSVPGLNMSVTELENCDAILLVGSNLQKEQPILNLRLRKAMKKGASILALNSVDYHFNFTLNAKQIVAPHKMVQHLQELVAACKAQDTKHALAAHLQGKQKVCILLGAQALHHSEAASLRYHAQQLAQVCNAYLSILTDGGNSAGAWLAGAVPHRQAGGEGLHHQGLSAYEMLAKARKAYLLLNVDPDLDCANPTLAKSALQQAKFVVALSLYRNPVLDAHADVILPMAAFTETSGTFMNVAGDWQSFHGVATPFGASRPAWKILRVLGNFLHLEGFDFESSEQVLEEFKKEVTACIQRGTFPLMQTFSAPPAQNGATKLSRIGEIPMYAVDSVVRHSEPLQKTQTIMEGEMPVAKMHPDTAAKWRVQTGQTISVKQHGTQSVHLPLVVDERIAPDAIWIPGAIAGTSELGDLMGGVELV